MYTQIIAFHQHAASHSLPFTYTATHTPTSNTSLHLSHSLTLIPIWMPCTHRHTLAPLFSAQCWPADQVRGRRLTSAPPTPSSSCSTLGPLTTILPPVPGESIQLDGWLQTGGLGAGMFLWHCRAQIPQSTGAQLNHSSLITVKAALAPAPTQH